MVVGEMRQTTIAQPGERKPLLTANRNRKMADPVLRMAGSLRPHGAAGGAAGLDLRRRQVGNLGPVGSADGSIAIEVRDLDQTVIGNPAHDLIRLGPSLAMAARGSALPGITKARILECLVNGYETAFAPEARGESSHER
jgi:hypothetical protein